MSLSSCADMSEPAPRPGVLEARACEKSINQSPPNYPSYIIKACTNNGVWVVEQRDAVTGLVLETYDFVNGEYTGPLTGGNTLPFESCTLDQQQEFKILRHELNLDLVAGKDKKTPKKPATGKESKLLSWFPF